MRIPVSLVFVSNAEIKYAYRLRSPSLFKLQGKLLTFKDISRSRRLNASYATRSTGRSIIGGP